MKTKLMLCRTIFIAAMLALYIVPSAAQQLSSYANELMQVRATWDCGFQLDTLKNDTVRTVRLPASYSLNMDVHPTTTIYAGKNDPGTCPDGQHWHTYRMCYKWDLSLIPDSATIKSATVEIWYSASSQTSPDVLFSLYPYGLTNWINDGGKVWSACSLGTAYATRQVDCTIQTKSEIINFLGSHQFCRDIANSIPSKAFAIDIATNDDQLWSQQNLNRYLRLQQNGNAIQSVKLTINYTYPINVTVRNGIPGNGDTVIVDGTKYPSPHQFSWTSSDPHTLLAKTATVGGTTYSPTGWINKTRTEPPYPNPATVSPIENTVYEATFIIISLPVTVDQKFSSEVLTYKLVNGSSVPVGVGEWNGSGFTPQPNPWTPTFNVGTSYCLQGTQEPLYDYDYEQREKYKIWTKNDVNQPDVINHRSFLIDQTTAHLTSQFQQTTEGSTIRADLLDYPGSYSNLSIQFKDPWLIDYPDPNYGNNLRNQGMSAPFKNRPSPFWPNLSYTWNGDVYRGVFLGLDPSHGATNYYSVGAPSLQSFTIGSKTISGAFQYWLGQYATFPNGAAQQTGVVFQSGNATATAQYKGIHISNNASAFSRNSQKKLLQTIVNGNRWMHQVYASAGYVWIEHSTDNGATWTIGNGGKALGSGKNPSIYFTPKNSWGNSYIGVAWQQQSGSTYTIQGMLFNQIASTNGLPYSLTGSTTLFTEQYDSYSIDANPNIVVDVNSMMYMITFERKSTYNGWLPKIYWLVGFFSDYGSQAYGLGLPISGYIDGTDGSSTNAAISLNPNFSNGSNADLDCIYQTSNGLRTLWLHWQNVGGLPIFTQGTPAAIGYGGPVNVNPSIVSFPNGYFAVSYIEYDQLVYCYSANPSVLYYYATGVQSCAINRGGDNSGFVAWSQNNYGSWYNKSIRFQNYVPSGSTIQTLSTTGKYVQLANSVTSGLSNMYVSSFYPFSAPYSFGTSGQLGPLSKDAAGLVAGRGFEINIGGSSYSYRFEDLNVDGKNIGFVDAPDTLDYSRIEALNNVLVTEPFQLKSKSKVVLSERSGFSDSAAAVNAFGKDGFIRYKVELIDDATSKALGTIRKVELKSADAYSFKTSSNSLNVNGIASGTVRIKITLSTNLLDGASAQSANSVSASGTSKTDRFSFPQSSLTLAKRLAEENAALVKSSLDELRMESEKIPTCFALAQNYPNPFNPTTVISYQLPVVSHLSLKVYDVLGREVATLADGVKEAGSYSATFDGTHLASGVYIMRLSAMPEDGSKPFVQVRKMVLMK
jgi:hypothetical protein